METWMFNVFVAVMGVVASFSVLRNKVTETIERNREQDIRFKELQNQINKKIYYLDAFKNETAPTIESLSKNEEIMLQKLEENGKKIVELQQTTANSPSMKEVRAEFVTKELYLQMKEHIDEKFSKLELGLSEILKELRSSNG